MIALGYIWAWKLLAKVPPTWAHSFARRLAPRFTRDKQGHIGQGPTQLRKNLARVLGCAPEEVPPGLMVAAMRSYLRYWVEAFQLPKIAGRELAQRVEAQLEGFDHLVESFEKGKGVILVLPHSGNWDMAGMFLVEYLSKFTTVAERLKPEALYEAFVDYRESLGFRILPLTGGSDTSGQLAETLTSGGIIALLGDRDFTKTGVPVEFFGSETTMPAGPALLAHQTGAALHVVGLWFTPPTKQDPWGGWGTKVHPAIEVANQTLNETVQEIANRMASDIAAHPADWHMFQPLWPSDRRKR